jgi:hypothetical protein
MLRSELSYSTKGLCNEDTRMTEWLFGDDLKRELKDAELGDKITGSKNWRGD